MTWLTPYLADALEQWSDLGRYGWSAFACRNLRIERRLSVERQGEYLDHIGEPHNRSAWEERHREYDLVHVAARDLTPRLVMQKRERDRWPSPFRWLGTPLDLAPEVQLLHAASVYQLSAATPGVESDDVIEAVQDHDEDYLDMLLDGWWRRSTGRTIFAARADDLTATVDAALRGEVTWGDDVRDRLGLSYERLRDPIDLVLLRYRVSEVPRAEGLREKRPIVAPTAIDSRLFEAFCPVAQVDVEGRCVDLAARVDAPVREVLHPRPMLFARHVIGHGQVTKRPGDHDLSEARAYHLEWVRDQLGPQDFADETDADLAA